MFAAAATLLSRSREALFLLGYVSRAASIDRALGEQAQQAGLVLQEIGGTRQRVAGGLEGWVCSVTWPTQTVVDAAKESAGGAPRTWSCCFGGRRV